MVFYSSGPVSGISLYLYITLTSVSDIEYTKESFKDWYWPFENEKMSIRNGNKDINDASLFLNLSYDLKWQTE